MPDGFLQSPVVSFRFPLRSCVFCGVNSCESILSYASRYQASLVTLPTFLVRAAVRLLDSVSVNSFEPILSYALRATASIVTLPSFRGHAAVRLLDSTR